MDIWVVSILCVCVCVSIVNDVLTNICVQVFVCLDTFLFFQCLFIWLGLSYGMWDLVPWPEIKPRPRALGAASLPVDHQGHLWIYVFIPLK